MSSPSQEPTEEEIYGKLTKEIQERWTEAEWLKRGRRGNKAPGIREIDTTKWGPEKPPKDI